MIFQNIKSHTDFYNQVKDYLDGKKFSYNDFEIGGSKIRTYFYNLAVGFEEFNQHPLLFEMRGITFDLDRDIVISRPFHKFFNLGELPQSEIDLSKIISIQTKLDGSMIHPFLIGTTVYFKTKKSPFSSVAELFSKWIQKQDFYSDFIMWNRWLLMRNITPIYEFYYPNSDADIVISYEKPFVKLLAIRETISGLYIEFNSIDELYKELQKKDSAIYRFSFLSGDFIPKRWNFTLEELKHQSKKLKDFEGYVIVNDKSQRYKVKTEWYIQVHRTLTSLSDKRIIEAVFSGTDEDIIQLAKQLNKTHIVNRIQSFKSKINQLVNEIYNEIQFMDLPFEQKLRALYLKKVEFKDKFLSGVIFKLLIREDPQNITKEKIIKALYSGKKKEINYFKSIIEEGV